MSAADFLITQSLQRVLATTLGNPEQEFTLAELLAAAACGRGSTQLQIDRLVTAGILQEGPRRGRNRSIKANTGHLLYPELRSIMHKTFGVVEPLQAALQPFAEHVESAFVFGSVAEGTDTHRSDLDLAVIGTVSLLKLAPAMDKTQALLGRAIHLNLYGPQEWNQLVENDPVMRRISGGPKLILLPK